MSSHYDGTFSFARHPPFPTLYGANKTPVTADVLETGWIVAFFTLFTCFLLVLPAVAGKQVTFYVLRLTVTLFIGFVIMYCNFGQEWEKGSVETKMFYKAGSHEEITGRVEVKLGLRSVNVTLRATEDPQGDLAGETINYNERFYWTWEQGRAGFGRFAGLLNRSFREAQFKGLPYPILWAAEYFTFDGEGLRFGRHYRLAGWYTHMCIWAAFPIWILFIITIKFVVVYAAKLLMILGGLLVSASIIWSSHRNFRELAIVYDNEEHGTLRTHYGIHWHLSLYTGIFCIVCGALMYILSFKYYDELCKIFGLDPLGVLEFEEGSEEDETEEQPADAEKGMEMSDMKQSKQKRTLTVKFRPKGTSRWRASIRMKDDKKPAASKRMQNKVTSSQGKVETLQEKLRKVESIQEEEEDDGLYDNIDYEGNDQIEGDDGIYTDLSVNHFAEEDDDIYSDVIPARGHQTHL